MIILKVDGTGQCDAKCYNAQTEAKNCGCVCQGMNHGAGWTQAIRNVQEHQQELEQLHGRKQTQFTEHIRQLLLF